MKQKFFIFVVTALASLSFADKTVVDLGSTAIHTPLRRTVTYKNDNRFKPVQIKRVESSCSCLRVLSHPSEVAAGSSDEIVLELTPDKTGVLDYTLAVVTASGDYRIFSLNVDVQPSESQMASSLVEMPSRVITPRDQSLYLTPVDISAILSKPSFVDVRSKTEYRQCHIPGSMNLSRSFVRTKGWLKSKPVILVDGGWGDPALEKTAQSLRNSGFSSVHILHGGLAAWRTAGQRTEGILPGLPSLSELSASDYLRTRNFDDWLVLNSCSDAEALSLPESTIFSLPTNGEQLQKELSAMVDGTRKRILIVDENGSIGSSIRRLLADWNGAPVFYLKDGVQGC